MIIQRSMQPYTASRSQPKALWVRLATYFSKELDFLGEISGNIYQVYFWLDIINFAVYIFWEILILAKKDTSFIFLLYNSIVKNKGNIFHHRNFLISTLIPALLCSQIVGTIVKASRSEYTIDFCITWACRAFLKETDFTGLRVNDHIFWENPIYQPIVYSHFVKVYG